MGVLGECVGERASGGEGYKNVLSKGVVKRIGGGLNAEWC